ncbi:MAG: VWA domain-containing protein, partial [Desulfovibrio sp.]|nr:VWA domain-containing protein [Desulfovibrio sp.]
MIKFSRFRALLFPLLLAAAFSFTAAPSGAAQPLLQEGKKSVFQRVVTHPGAKLYAGPEAGAATLRESIPTFTALYIYDRQGDRLQVGAGSDKADGWIDKALVTEWPQAITMVLTDRTGREPVLFFRNHDGLEQACRADDLKGLLAGYRQELASGKELPADYPVIATEPAASAVAEKNFYLLPVLSIDDQFYGQHGPRLIEVASIDPGIGEARGEANAAGGAKSPAA